MVPAAVTPWWRADATHPTHTHAARTQAVAQLHTGWHVALYIADYSAPFRRVEALGLIDNDHPFR